MDTMAVVRSLVVTDLDCHQTKDTPVICISSQQREYALPQVTQTARPSLTHEVLVPDQIRYSPPDVLDQRILVYNVLLPLDILTVVSRVAEDVTGIVVDVIKLIDCQFKTLVARPKAPSARDPSQRDGRHDPQTECCHASKQARRQEERLGPGYSVLRRRSSLVLRGHDVLQSLLDRVKDGAYPVHQRWLVTRLAGDEVWGGGHGSSRDRNGNTEGGTGGAHLVGVVLDDEVLVGGGHDAGLGVHPAEDALQARDRPDGGGLEAVRAPVSVESVRLLWEVVDRVLGLLPGSGRETFGQSMDVESCPTFEKGVS